MGKSRELVGRLAEMQKAYDFPISICSYENETGETVFTVDTGVYSSTDKDLSVAISNIIWLVKTKEFKEIKPCQTQQ